MDKTSSSVLPSVGALSEAEFWAGVREVQTVLDGLKPFAWEEAEWAKQTKRTQEALGTVGTWALARCARLVLNYWHRAAPTPGEALLHQAERAGIALIPPWKFVLARIDTDITDGFVIENDPDMAEFARDSFLTACGLREQIVQDTLLRELMTRKRPAGD